MRQSIDRPGLSYSFNVERSMLNALSFTLYILPAHSSSRPRTLFLVVQAIQVPIRQNGVLDVLLDPIAAGQFQPHRTLLGRHLD